MKCSLDKNTPLRNPQFELMELMSAGYSKRIRTNRDWLNSLSPVELANWIKNEAAAMSDAELLKWMEEKKV